MNFNTVICPFFYYYFKNMKEEQEDWKINSIYLNKIVEDLDNELNETNKIQEYGFGIIQKEIDDINERM